MALDHSGKQTNSRITYLCPNDVSNILMQWASWISGQVGKLIAKFHSRFVSDFPSCCTAVPLCSSHPPELLEYYINDSQSNLILTTPEFEAKVKPIADKLKKPLLTIEHQQLIDEATKKLDQDSLVTEIPDGEFYNNSPAMIVYTSGTTNKPKGVVLSHANLEAQIASLTHAWNIQPTDTILHTLPLHHVHGIINAMLLPLSSGGKVIMLPKFDTEKAWSYLLNINMPQKDRITLFMGVPTIYNYLIQEYDKLFSKNSQMSEYIKTHCKSKIRLMISGSAPLPATVFQRWTEITGHKLLERYGMTEIGMALSNTLTEDKVKQRLPGFVGQPLPSVQIRITSADNNKDVLLEAHGEFNKGLWSNDDFKDSATIKIKSGISSDSEVIGNLEVKGPTVFKEYWSMPEATKKEFTDDGYFITGDSVCYDPNVSSFKILGRNSADIIKSRGYKISALEMETKLLENRIIEDCVVIGVPHEAYGQQVVALIKTRNVNGAESTEQETAIRKWCLNKFADYSMPTIQIVSAVPRNQMGKVNKQELLKDFLAKGN